MLSSDWGDYQISSPGGCTWIRFFRPAQEMSNLGVDVAIGEVGWVDGEGFVAVPTVERLMARDRGPIKNPKQYETGDVVIFKLWMWHEWPEYFEKAKALGQTIIFDIDDWFHGLPTTNIAFQTTHPDRDALWNRNHMLQMYSRCHGLICSTTFLTDYYKKKNPRTYEVFNSVDPDFFIRRVDVGGWKPTVGWVGIMIWRSGDIETLQGWLGNFLEKHDLKFYHAGMTYENPKEFAEIAKTNPDRLFGVPGCSPQFYGNILMPMDIGIVPLNKLPFNDAKSGLKGIEYAATGVPFVAQGSMEYKKLAAEGMGNAADKPRDWIRKMEALLDPAVRKQQSDRGYELVMEKYNIKKVVHLWLETIEKIHHSNPNRRGTHEG